MKLLKNTIVGFLVSFVGSIPLGYLNIIGFEIYSKTGINELFLYLLGVVFIEGIVIYCTLIFANKLANNKKLIKFIELFSIFFMVLLACTFYFQSSNNTSNESQLTAYIGYAPFLIGLIFSSFNFIQIPFWTGWNLYLINAKYISTKNNLKLFYVIGTLIGTFAGMLALILFLNLLDNKFSSVSNIVIAYIIPIFFLGMGIYQGFKFYKKYYQTQKS